MVETVDLVEEKAVLDLDREKCTKLIALSVDKTVKFRSNLQKANQFTAENAIEKEEAFSSLFICRNSTILKSGGILSMFKNHIMY